MGFKLILCIFKDLVHTAVPVGPHSPWNSLEKSVAGVLSFKPDCQELHFKRLSAMLGSLSTLHPMNTFFFPKIWAGPKRIKPYAARAFQTCICCLAFPPPVLISVCSTLPHPLPPVQSPCCRLLPSAGGPSRPRP